MNSPTKTIKVDTDNAPGAPERPKYHATGRHNVEESRGNPTNPTVWTLFGDDTEEPKKKKARPTVA